MAAVSVDSPALADAMRRSSGASFEFLSDPQGVLLDYFGVRHVGGSIEGDDIAQSASFLLDSQGRVAWLRVAETYRVRPRPEEIVAAARRLFDGAQGPA